MTKQLRNEDIKVANYFRGKKSEAIAMTQQLEALDKASSKRPRFRSQATLQLTTAQKLPRNPTPFIASIVNQQANAMQTNIQTKHPYPYFLIKRQSFGSSPKRYIYNATVVPRAQGSLRKRRQKDYKDQRMREFAVRGSFPQSLTNMAAQE